MVIVCQYYFQGGDPEETLSSFILPDNPTLENLRDRWPYHGKFHFRAQLSSSYWLDLCNPNDQLPINPESNTAYIKVLQLSDEDNNISTPKTMAPGPQVDYYHHFIESQSRRHRTTNFSSNTVDQTLQTVGTVLKGMGSSAKAMKNLATKYFENTNSKSPPSNIAINELQSLVLAYKTSVNVNEAEHKEMLLRLWNALVKSKNEESSIVSSAEWKQVGFQKPDPLVDLRGFLSLQCLVYFAEVHRAVAKSMVHEQSALGKMNYPFAAVGVNLTLTLVDILQLQAPPDVLQSIPASYWGLFEDPIGFFELFCISFRIFDKCWKKSRASRVDFGRVLANTKHHVQTMLDSTTSSSITDVATLVEVFSHYVHSF